MPRRWSTAGLRAIRRDPSGCVDFSGCGLCLLFKFIAGNMRQMQGIPQFNEAAFEHLVICTKLMQFMQNSFDC
jgi:hypothetical protein